MLEFEHKTYIKEIDGKWYAFECNTESGNVYSIGNDDPREGGRWFARLTDDGIKYVARSCPTRNAAYRKARRYGKYCGEMI